jgi:hypothetical protein
MIYDVEVRKTKKKGRGVFALKNFKKGEIIEKCPVLKLKPAERRLCERTFLNHYIYPWKSLNDAVVVLGYGSIYNHSYEPNGKWVRDYKGENMVYKAIKPIKKGEEILIDYNGPYEKDEEDTVWFDVAE